MNPLQRLIVLAQQIYYCSQCGASGTGQGPCFVRGCGGYRG